MTHYNYTYHREADIVIENINWHPFVSNPLDYLDNQFLRTPAGEVVVIKKDNRGSGFTIYIDYDAHHVSGNAEACNLLHSKGVGRVVE